jgi:hypothetical protein
MVSPDSKTSSCAKNCGFLVVMVTLGTPYVTKVVHACRVQILQPQGPFLSEKLQMNREVLLGVFADGLNQLIG